MYSYNYHHNKKHCDKDAFGIEFANSISELDLGKTSSSIMSDCEKYGMCFGCDIGCPVLRRGDCELKDTDNKDLWITILKEKSNEK